MDAIRLRSTVPWSLPRDRVPGRCREVVRLAIRSHGLGSLAPSDGSAVIAVSPLYDAIRPLLRVAPSDCHLFYRADPPEVLVVREGLVVWLSVANVPPVQRRDEYRAIEWGRHSIDDMIAAHFFASRWELLTWLSSMFLAL